MTLVSLGLVLASAILHSIWNIWAKQIQDGTRASSLTWLLCSISAVFYAPIAITAAILTGTRPSPLMIGWMAASSVIHVSYFFVLLAGYRKSDLSVVYPVARGTGPLLAAVGAIALLGEKLTVLSACGIGLITIGILVLTMRPEFVHAPRLRAGVIYGLLTGLTIAVYTLWDGAGVSRMKINPLVYYWGGEVFRSLVLTPAALSDPAGVRGLLRNHRKRVIGIALISPFSYMLVLFALRTGQVSHIAPARELSILFGAWFGARLLGEGDRVRRVIAAASFAAGVIALALG